MRLATVVGLGILLAGVATAGDAKSDLAKLDGTWIFEKDGKKAEFKFTKDAFTITIDGFGTFKGTIKIDPSKKPKHMDLAIAEGPMFQGQTSLAIYDIDGDTLKWCAAEPGGGERATAFPEKEGDQGQHLYLVLKRTKK
jgi:uncharacterized protein (TIGR03067 family)